MRLLVVLLFVLAAFGVVAQGTGGQELPSDWGSVLALVVTGLPALIAVLRGGVNWAALTKSSTFWTALSGLVGAVGMYITGAIALPGLVAAIWFALAATFLRNAVANATATAAPPVGGYGAKGPSDSGISSMDFDRYR